MLVEIIEQVKTKNGFLTAGEIVDLPESAFKKLGAKVRPLPSNNQSPVPEWQHDFCLAHAMFNNWQGQCPYSIDECLISKIIDAGNCIDKMRGLNLGRGITTDRVIDAWIVSGEPIKDLIAKPLWFFCMAEYLQLKGKEGRL